MKKQDEANPWTTLSTETKYDNPWIRVSESQVVNPNGGRGIYGVIHFKSLAVGIIPIDDENHTWLVGQYRYPLKAYSWEIPEGGGPLDVPALETAKRELREECGIEAREYQQILTMHLSNSVTDELGIIFVARGLTLGTSHPDDDEQLTLRRVPLEEAFRMVMDGEITDGLSVGGLLKLKCLTERAASR